jgi:hypothetical protein
MCEYLFNEESKYCVVPEKYRVLGKAMDVNNDGMVSTDELNNAILEKVNGWGDFIRLKNKAYEIINDVKYKYDEFL